MQLLDSLRRMTTLADRINECMRETGLGQTDIARHLGIKQPSVANWLNGKTKKLVGMNLNRAAELFGVNPEWLDSGRGPKRIQSADLDVPEEFLDGPIDMGILVAGINLALPQLRPADLMRLKGIINRMLEEQEEALSRARLGLSGEPQGRAEPPVGAPVLSGGDKKQSQSKAPSLQAVAPGTSSRTTARARRS